MTVLPAVLKRCLANAKDCQKFEDEMKQEEIPDVYIKTDYSNDLTKIAHITLATINIYKR